MKKSIGKFAGGKHNKEEQVLGLSLRNLFEELAWRISPASSSKQAMQLNPMALCLLCASHDQKLCVIYIEIMSISWDYYVEHRFMYFACYMKVVPM